MDKEVYSIKDMESMLGVKYDTAAKIIREVRAVSDRLKISGHIHKLDWEDFLNIRGPGQNMSLQQKKDSAPTIENRALSIR